MCQNTERVNVVQLACVRPAASVHPEPGSNSCLFVRPHVDAELVLVLSSCFFLLVTHQVELPMVITIIYLL